MSDPLRATTHVKSSAERFSFEDRPSRECRVDSSILASQPFDRMDLPPGQGRWGPPTFVVGEDVKDITRE